LEKPSQLVATTDGMAFAIARAVKWDQQARSGTSLWQIAQRENLSAGYVTRVMALAVLRGTSFKQSVTGASPPI
jgi:hypothetical protein